MDPDDLIRREGAGAMRSVLEQAKPLIDVIWTRETGAGDWSTPERRAALEARLRALAQTIAEPTVRNYYARAFKDRLFQMFRAAPGTRRPQGRHRQAQSSWRQPMRGQPPERAAASEALTSSALVRRPTTGAHLREAVIVQTLLRHPWLLDEFADEVAALRLETDAAQRVLNGLIAAQVTINKLDTSVVRHHLHSMGADGALAQTETIAARAMGAQFGADVRRETVESSWRDIIALHTRASALKDELAAAEQAYFDVQSEEN